MSDLSKRLQRLEEVSQKQELERWVRSLTDDELLARIEAEYRRLVSAGWTEEAIFQVFPSMRDQGFTHVKVGEELSRKVLEAYRGSPK